MGNLDTAQKTSDVTVSSLAGLNVHTVISNQAAASVCILPSSRLLRVVRLQEGPILKLQSPLTSSSVHKKEVCV